MEFELLGRDIYMKHTGADGKSHVATHRVWDADLFVAARTAEAKAQRAKDLEETGKKTKHKAEQITREQFDAARAK